jgi:hypothetical protein
MINARGKELRAMICLGRLISSPVSSSCIRYAMVRSNNIFIGSKKNQSNQILQSDDAKITLNDFIAQIQFELKILH